MGPLSELEASPCSAPDGVISLLETAERPRSDTSLESQSDPCEKETNEFEMPLVVLEITMHRGYTRFCQMRMIVYKRCVIGTSGSRHVTSSVRTAQASSWWISIAAWRVMPRVIFQIIQ